MWQQVILTTTSTILPIIAYPFLPSTSCGNTYSLIVLVNFLVFHFPNIIVYFDFMEQQQQNQQTVTGGDTSSFSFLLLLLLLFLLPTLSWIGYPLAHLKWHTELQIQTQIHGGLEVVNRHHIRFDEAGDFAVWMVMLGVYLVCEAFLGLGHGYGYGQKGYYDISREQVLSVGRFSLAIGISAVHLLVRGRGHELWVKRVIGDWLWGFTMQRKMGVCFWRRWTRRWWFFTKDRREDYYDLDGGEEEEEERLPGGYGHDVKQYMLRRSKWVHEWLWISVWVLVVLQLGTLILLYI